MSDKVVTSVYIDEALKERLDTEPGINASGLFNQMLRDYFAAGEAPDGLDRRIQHVNDEIEAKQRERDRLDDEIEELQTELAELRDLKEEKEREKAKQFRETVERLSRVARRNGRRRLDERLVSNQARKIGITPDELRSAVEERVDQESAGHAPRSDGV